MRDSMYDVLKRAMDLALALVLIVLTFPVIVAVGLAIQLTMSRPILFLQVRPGKDSIPFTIYKFRTMRPEAGQGAHGGEQYRITALGRFLRKSSLDELPELFNVLRGEMSFVGPRPLLSEYLPYYTTTEQARHSVLPGITGWAQVNGRNAVSWDERLAMDVWYVNNRSILLDLRILLMTVGAVFKAKGLDVDPRSAMSDLHVERASHAHG